MTDPEAASRSYERAHSDSNTFTSTGPSRSAKKQAKRGPRASFRELVPYLLAQKGLLALALVLGAVSALAALLQPVFVGQIIERVQSASPLGLLVGGLIALVVISAILDGLQHYTLQRMGEGVVLHARKSLISKILFLPIPEFDRRRSGDMVSRIGSDTTLLRAVLTQGFVEAMSGLLVFFGALIGMLIIDPILFLATFAVLAVALLVVVYVSGRMRPIVTQAQEKVGDLAASVDRAISGVRTIRAAGAAEREAQVITGQAESAYSLGLKIAKLSAFVVPVSFIALQASFLVVLGFGGYRVATGATTIAQLVMFIIFVFLMITPLGQAFGAIAAINQALGALGRIRDITSLETEAQNDAANSPSQRVVSLAEARVPGAPAITLENVHFTYRSAAPERMDVRELVRGARGSARRELEALPPQIVETPVLHGVSFSVPRGSRVALVGPSGAGKSTVLSLIERFSDPDSGRVLFDGADLRELDRAELRAQLGYVEQDAPVLAGTVRDNLTLGAPNVSDEDCEKVLESVNLSQLVNRTAEHAGLETGLDAQVGEHGILLSGGEKQRLAIARTLLGAAPVLLLDESTASLDGVNERLMREALDAVAVGRTMLVIAHRLSTVVDSDLIVVLDEGKVVGQGTHDELVKTVPLYQELARHQLLVPENT
jgi:ABC-type multidrug transport system fused ATPase/permease subunit